MKYLAILKDSFREAIDTKVFYVTIGLSLLLAFVLASVSFLPVPAEEALKHMTSKFLVVYRDRGQSLIPERVFVDYQISDLQQLNSAAEPQAGDYRFTLTCPATKLRQAAQVWNSPASADLGEAPNPDSIPDAVVEDYLRGQFAVHGNLEVSSVHKLPSSTADKLALQVETKGTKAVRGWLHDPCLFFGTVPLRPFRTTLGFAVFWIEDGLVNGLGGWIGILIGVVITAFFIPNMLRKGTIDLLLVKPIHRSTLLLYKYIGGLTFVFLNSAVAVLGIWLVLGWRSGIWASGFLLTILVLTFFFAVLYAVSTLFGVLTQSAIVSILMTCLAWFGLWIVGQGYDFLQLVRNEKRLSQQMNLPEWVHSTVNGLHYALPRTNDLNVLTGKLLSREIMDEGELRSRRLDRLPDMSWGESLTVSGLFIGILLGISCWRVATKDF